MNAKGGGGMHSNKKNAVIITSSMAVIGVVTAAVYQYNESFPKNLTPAEKLAVCLSKSGAVMYGTTWCGYCNKQLAQFGPEARQYVTYVDCSLPNGERGFKKECLEKGVRVVPSWGMPDGRVLKGTQSLMTLAVESGCWKQGKRAVESGKEK